MSLKIAIANDHGGFALKNFLIKQFDSVPVEWVDLGTGSDASVDYPDYGYKLADAIEAGKADFGIGICGSGIGISIALNRRPGIRAGLCTDTTMARLTRLHNDANVLCLGARIIGEEVAKDIVRVFLTTEFEGGRHCGRVEKLTKG
jgi:ribose 5-phosphate isomerase B